jgi:putative RNA 2'-phosphotransferase
MKEISKFLSLVLRHRPDKIGLELDDHGWADVGQLIRAAGENGVRFNEELLCEVVRTNDKKRFMLSDDGLRIRANQGHSVSVDLNLEPALPPPVLYHGTVARFIESIKDKGLLKGERHHVHLSPDDETATKVGERRGKPILLSIDAEAMAKDGHMFYRSENGVWLTLEVPPQFIGFPQTGNTIP